METAPGRCGRQWLRKASYWAGLSPVSPNATKDPQNIHRGIR